MYVQHNLSVLHTASTASARPAVLLSLLAVSGAPQPASDGQKIVAEKMVL